MVPITPSCFPQSSPSKTALPARSLFLLTGRPFLPRRVDLPSGNTLPSGTPVRPSSHPATPSCFRNPSHFCTSFPIMGMKPENHRTNLLIFSYLELAIILIMTDSCHAIQILKSIHEFSLPGFVIDCFPPVGCCRFAGLFLIPGTVQRAFYPRRWSFIANTGSILLSRRAGKRQPEALAGRRRSDHLIEYGRHPGRQWQFYSQMDG